MWNMLLTHEIAQPIIETLEEAFPCKVTITDANGFIIGTSIPSRLNLFQPSAYEVICGREPIEKLRPDGQWEVPDGVMLGYGERIICNGKCIGLVGLVGPPEEMQSYMKTVMTMLKLLLDRVKTQEQLSLLVHEKNSFITTLLLNQNQDEKWIETRSRFYKFDMSLPRTVVVVKPCFSKGDMEQPLVQTTIMRRLLSLAGDVFHHRQDMVCELNNGLIVAITVGNGSGMAARRKDNICRAVLNLSEYAKRQCGLDLLIGIGAEIPQVSRYHISYEQAGLALNIGCRSAAVSGVFRYEDMLLERTAMSMDDRTADALWEQIIEKLLAGGSTSLIETMDCYFANNGNVAETAQALFLHRNTLQYRFNQIKELTGFDIRRIDDMILLRLAVLRYTYKK